MKNKIIKVNLKHSILKYDVIHDTLKVIFNKNLERLSEFGNIDFFGVIGTGEILAKNH